MRGWRPGGAHRQPDRRGGIGKSRLMAEWRAELGDRARWVRGPRLRAHHWPCLRPVPRPASAATPRISDEDSEAEARARLRQQRPTLPGDADAQAVFANLLAMRLTRRANIARGAARRGRCAAAFVRPRASSSAWRRSARSLVIEDMHWAELPRARTGRYPAATDRAAAAGRWRRRSAQRRPDQTAAIFQSREARYHRRACPPRTPLSESSSRRWSRSCCPATAVHPGRNHDPGQGRRQPVFRRRSDCAR